MIDDILEFNKKFVESKGYEKYITNKYPDKKIAILSCMDTRLTKGCCGNRCLSDEIALQ